MIKSIICNYKKLINKYEKIKKKLKKFTHHILHI